MADDYRAGTSTTGTVTVGGSATGDIERKGDVDWFAVELVAGRTYVIDLEGAGAGTGTLGDTMLWGLFDAAGGRVAKRSRDGGEGNDARMTFTATESGTFYIAARGQRKDDTGTYTVRVRDQDAATQTPSVNTNTPQVPEQTSGQQQAPQPPADPDATAAGAAGLGNLAGGRLVRRDGTVDGGDDVTDYYSFTLGERQTVTLSLRRQDANADLYLEDGDGTVLASSTESRTRNEGIEQTLDAGTYYVRVAAQEAGDNDYALRAKAVDPAPAPSPETPVPQPQQPQVPGSQQQQQQQLQQITPTSVSEPGDGDLPADTSTTGRVVVGGSATGEIQRQYDQDWFAVTLEAGTVYQFDQKGLLSGYGTLGSPQLHGIYNADGNLIEGTTNGSDGWMIGSSYFVLDSRVYFAPTEDGTYYVSAGGSNGWDRGTYTLEVRAVPADDFTAGTDTTGSVAVGGSATGEIACPGDEDWFAVTLEAGKSYRFDLEGLGTGGGTLPDPHLVGIHDSEGSLIEGTTNDDRGGAGAPSDEEFSSGALNSRVEFTATEDGTYYVSASSPAALAFCDGVYMYQLSTSMVVGTYTLSVSEIDAM